MKNRVALVTGGVGVLGTAICQQLAKDGAKVVAVDRVETKVAQLWQLEQKKLGYDIDFNSVDITDYTSCEEAIKYIEAHFGNVDILVNNAGVNRDALFRKMTPEQWSTVINTDLDGLFNMTRPLVNGMCDRGYGRIINISSVSAQHGQFGQTNYSAAKSGVHGFTKSLARELARFGITVNTVSPGFIESKMVMAIPDNIRDQIIKQVPVGRMGQPDEIAWTISFLAHERSAFITGSNVSVNGGLHMY